MLPITPATARLSDFSAPSNRLLFGEKLNAVRSIQTSIQNRGMFNPLIVAKDGNRLIVIDGHKRLAALRRMQFQGQLPRSLVRVPYIVVNQGHLSDPNFTDNPLKLLSNAEAYIYVKGLRRRGRSAAEIAEILYTSETYVQNLLSVEGLSKKLKTLFLTEKISIQQVCAFAVLPNPKLQDVVIEAVGPAASRSKILKVGTKLARALKSRSKMRSKPSRIAAA